MNPEEQLGTWASVMKDLCPNVYIGGIYFNKNRFLLIKDTKYNLRNGNNWRGADKSHGITPLGTDSAKGLRAGESREASETQETLPNYRSG